ncbi:MAG: hypothetical protein AMS27_02160 [Bacteroides sp. SM23_62_1]|nr:MAG: hypothetical protein AMS27_02160 [Bacteroides sp. SM23_62_1]
MENLTIAATDFTPEVSFNIESLIFRIGGVSRPEDVRNFYDQIIDWLSNLGNYFSKNKSADSGMYKVLMEFRLAYFNSASSKQIIEILNCIKRFKVYGIDLEVNWYYDEGDEQMRDDGEELAEACDLEFNYYVIS